MVQIRGALAMPPGSVPHQPIPSDVGDAACLAHMCFGADSYRVSSRLFRASLLLFWPLDAPFRCGTPCQRCVTACAYSARTSASWGLPQSDVVV